MSYDIDLLKVVGNKDKYERFKEYVKKHNVSSITKNIFDVLGDYWATYPTHTEINVDDLRTFFFLVKGKKVKDTTAYETVFDNLKTPSSSVMEEAIIKRLIEVDYATRIYEEAAGYVSNVAGKDISNIAPLLDAMQAELGSTEAEETPFVEPTLSYLRDVLSTPGLVWRLPEFRISMGPLRKGDFIILGARPEVGKTTLIASEITYMLEQIEDGRHIVWVNNEEASAKVMMRCIQAMFQVTTKELLDDVGKYEAEFMASGGNRLLLVKDDGPYKNASKIDMLLRKYPPALVVFDQLDKVKGFSNEKRDDLRIGSLYEWARDISKTMCPVIAVSQLDGSAEGMKWCTMDHLRGSKTDKPGEADAIVLIGDERDGTLNRYISIAKNKLVGDKHTLEEHRHGTFHVSIDPPKARYVSKWKT